MSRRDENCRDCVFRATLNFYGINWIICNYLGVMGRRRGCPPGKNCLRKIRGPKRDSLDARLYRMPPNPERKMLPPAGGTGAPSSAPSGHLPPGEGKGTDCHGPADLAMTGEEKKTAEEIAARIAEKKRKKAEQHRAWVARNREHLREYQQERRRQAKEAAERGTGVPSSVPSGQLPPGEAKETL